MLNIRNHRHAWWLVTFVALLPLWLVGMFGRGYWTPDEPREGDIAWRMSIQDNQTLPQLADVQFLEKPPLSYWISAAAIRTFGNTPAIARIPNLLYAAITSLAIGLLVFTMAGAAPAVIAAIVSGSAFTSYQVAIWLAPDACLVAGCAVSLLGLYRGYIANTARGKFWWYSLMHVGALIGFMAKSAPGWIIPALTLLVLIAWERRWNELKHWQLWAGLILQLCVIGTWMTAVWHEPQGPAALRILFWNNLVGRFGNLHAAGALDYASAHKNWFGKYLVELPYYLFPWTILTSAALYRAWSATRIAGIAGTPWRFAIAASLPFLLLLSLSTTARSIYSAPALLGLGVLVGLWSKEMVSKTARLNVLAISMTRFCICFFVAVMLIVLGLMCTAAISIGIVVAMIVIATCAFIAIRHSLLAQRQEKFSSSIAWLYAVYAVTIVVGATASFPKIDRWQDLASLAQRINRDTHGSTLALLKPDETTVAMLDNQLRTPFIAIECSHEEQLQLATQWLRLHSDHGLMLIDLPGHASGEYTELLSRFSPKRQPDDGILAVLEKNNIAHVVARYDLPHGRRYALIESGRPQLVQTTINSIPES